MKGSGNIVLGAVLALVASLSGIRSAAAAEPAASIPAIDAIRLTEVYRLVEELGDQIWPGFAQVAFPIVLVTEEREFLVGWDGSIPEGFEDLGVDLRLGRGVSSRQRTFPPGLSASFPAFGPPAVVVIGTAETTGRTSAQWVLTVLHEHLHQLQYASPDYYQGVAALDLSNGDETGMWMLDYPFPYEDQAIGAKFAELAETTRNAMARDELGLETRPGPGTDSRAAPWSALRGLLNRLEPADERYLSFQLWQEGIGRYLELRAAEVAASAFEPSARFTALEDAVSWAEEARALRERILNELEGAALAENGRVSFYALGAALGVLLDRDAPDWKGLYLEQRFALDQYAPSD